MQPLVSICIPTYNRAGCLVKTIESIIVQKEFLSGEVEIVISDNASEDNTTEVCKPYLKYDNFFYNRNAENLRDKNYSIVLSEAHGKLRKLNNDTFVLNSNSLENLCFLAKKYCISKPLIFLRNEPGDIKELNFREFVIDVGHWVTWIAGFTMWGDECEKIESDTDGCELFLWQVKKVYELVYKKKLAIVSYHVLGNSILPPKKDISYGVYKVFYCNYMSLLQPYVDNGALNMADIKYLEKQLLFDFFPGLIIQHELNNTDMLYSNEENLKSAVWNTYKHKPYWPLFLCKYYAKLYFMKSKLLVNKLLGRK